MKTLTPQQADLDDLISIPFEKRDASWEPKFFQALTNSNVKIMSPDPHPGPDGWPYLFVETSPHATEPSQKVIQWLAEKGIGMVVNATKTYPDYVFTYGMLWHFRQTGLFFQQRDEATSGTVEFASHEVLNAGDPSPEYLPPAVRKILREFFRDQGVFAPKVLVMSTDNTNYDLAISLESIKSPPEHEHAGIAEAIGWFLPPHYSILLVSEQGLPPFFDL